MKETESLFINSEITVVSKINDLQVIKASKATAEPSNASVIATFQENMKKFKNPTDSLTEDLGEGREGAGNA